MNREPVATCASRISFALGLRGLRQYELCAKTGIPKSAMSQYISGAFEPKNDRLYLIAQALDVNPVWLMGYDVPMEKITPDEPELTEGERTLIELFRRIPDDRKDLVLGMIRAAVQQIDSEE